MGRRARDVPPHARFDEGVRHLIGIDGSQATSADAPRGDAPATLEARIERALDRIRPAIRRDGGDVWLVRVVDDVAYVQMIGACGGCPASHATLKGGIEAVVLADVPQIRAVEQL
jgi:Fe-S cluster biogenesis protein NfuA